MSRILPDHDAKRIKDALIQLIEHVEPEIEHFEAMEMDEQANELREMITEARAASGLI